VNAGIAKLGSVAETTEEVFDEIVDANFPRRLLHNHPKS
jgi:hypothetical protein